MRKKSKVQEALPFYVVANDLLRMDIIEEKIPYNVKCPFHPDDTPSMRVFDDGLAYCYGCAKQYDGFSIIMDYCGGDYKAAVKLAKERYNFNFKASDDREQRELNKRQLYTLAREVNSTVDETNYKKLLRKIHTTMESL